MQYYVGFALVAALQTLLPWAAQGASNGNNSISCGVFVWVWLLCGASFGWMCQLTLLTPGMPPPSNIVCVGAAVSAAAFLLPPTMASVPVVAALFGIAASTLAQARTAVIAFEARQASEAESSAWSLAADYQSQNQTD